MSGGVNPTSAHGAAKPGGRPGSGEAREAPSEEGLRASVYGLLAALLGYPPSTDLLPDLRAIQRAEPGGRQQALAVAWETLRLAAEATTPEEMSEEYHELFIGVGRGELVPYGSWYITGFMMEQPLALLRRDLQALGIERAPEVKDPEDHVAALCEVMVCIIDGAEDTRDAQRKFFADHIAPWFEAFFKDLQEAKSARFYRSVGRLGEAFIGVERQYLSMTT